MDETKKPLKEKFFNIAGANFVTIIISAFILQLGNLFSHYLFQKSSIVVTFVLFLIVLGSYLLLKDVTDEKNKKLGLMIAKLSLVILVFSTVNHMFIAMTETLARVSPDKAGSLFRLSYFLNFAIGFGAFAFFRNESVKEALNNVNEQSTLDLLKIGGMNKNELKPGDIQLCVNVDTKKPVILKAKDR